MAKQTVMLQVATVAFNVGHGKDRKRVSFEVEHNMPEVLGLSLQDAVENWAVRTDDPTPESLIAYINSKGTGYICRLHHHNHAEDDIEDGLTDQQVALLAMFTEVCDVLDPEEKVENVEELLFAEQASIEQGNVSLLNDKQKEWLKDYVKIMSEPDEE